MNFLPGWGMGVPVAAGGLALAVAGSGTDVSIAGVVTSSVEIQAGDLLVMAGSIFDFSGTNFPPGMTSAHTQVDSAPSKVGIFYKIADGDEGTTVTGFTGDSGSLEATNMLYVFRGDVAISSVTVGDPEGQNTSEDPSAQTVSASGGTPPLVVVASYISSGAISPRTFSPDKDGEINASTAAWLAYKIYNKTPADVTVDMDDEGSGNTLMSCYLACAA